MSNNWLLLGPELGQKKAFIKEIQDNLTKKLGEAPELHKVYPFDSQMSETVSLMQNGSLFSPHKLVILDNAEEIKAADAKLLINYLASPSSETTLLMLSIKNGLDSKKLEKAIPAKNKKVFWEMFENQKNSWIIAFFRQRKRDIESDAVETLLELVMNNTEEMKAACEQLCTHYHEGHRINEEDVDRVIYHSREETVFTLFDKIACKDLSASLEINNKMILSKSSDPVQTIAGLTWQFGRFLEFKTLYNQMKDSGAAFSQCGIRGKRAQQQYLTAERKYTIRELQQTVGRLAEADRQIRESGTGLQSHLLQMLIFHIINPQKNSI